MGEAGDGWSSRAFLPICVLEKLLLCFTSVFVFVCVCELNQTVNLEGGMRLLSLRCSLGQRYSEEQWQGLILSCLYNVNTEERERQWEKEVLRRRGRKGGCDTKWGWKVKRSEEVKSLSLLALSDINSLSSLPPRPVSASQLNSNQWKSLIIPAACNAVELISAPALRWYSAEL